MCLLIQSVRYEEEEEEEEEAGNGGPKQTSQGLLLIT